MIDIGSQTDIDDFPDPFSACQLQWMRSRPGISFLDANSASLGA
jgi:hypothetical protein